MLKQLRPEARPAEWGKLDAGQKKAFQRLVELIAEAIGDLPEKQSRVVPPGDPYTRLSQSKSSRTAFLSGGRGTGKTTVLLSLRRATERELFQDPSTAEYL